MLDFLISIFVTLLTNIYIIQPYWDQLREYWLNSGYTVDQISTQYNLLCAASYILVGCFVYFVIALVKLIARKSTK